MKRVLLLLLFTFSLHAEWRIVAKGVAYQRITRGTIDAHVAKIDLREKSLRLVATDKRDSGTTVSEFAKRSKAIVAINGDYFDKQMIPTGLAMSVCGLWAKAKPVRRQPVVGVGKRRATIAFLEKPRRWMTGAVAGWPLLVEKCTPLEKLPGSDSFTRAPHPRTAVGLSKDGRTMYLVVADGRRQGVPGMTLPELADFMAELGSCTAVNLDGGGSSAMWIDDRIVNRPSDPVERAVTNHLAVIDADDYSGCPRKTNE